MLTEADMDSKGSKEMDRLKVNWLVNGSSMHQTLAFTTLCTNSAGASFSPIKAPRDLEHKVPKGATSWVSGKVPRLMSLDLLWEPQEVT